MNPAQQGKIRRFMDDTQMSDTVHEVLLKAFMKPTPVSDVYVLAASRLAIDLLEQALKDLKRPREEDKITKTSNVGV